MQEDLTKEAIEKNIRTLKTQLNGSSLHFADELSAALDGIESKLSWEMPLASGVLYSQSKEIEELGADENRKVPTPSFVAELCNKFIENISDDDITDVSIEELSHDNCMKESDEVLQEVTSRILEILETVWEAPAFSKRFIKSQSEGTYVTDVIVPIIRAALKNLPIKNSIFVSTAERQSIASKDRKGEYGKRPDVMLIAKYKNKTHELIYAECSRPINSDQFGILGVQVAAQILHLSVLIRDEDQIHRLYHLRSVEIPIHLTKNSQKLIDFVDTLLFTSEHNNR
ncbi:hypothetical protein F8M41_020566 [Gigaspora margarita]|uniref:Uncharacterized protein n=1 Tax=Gigaspora margarita TaxID=4874 RepID=A0A8H4ETT1_GIGMA|nr:hypothetical protein F8M41_020566 [Gigaspora margarita]